MNIECFLYNIINSNFVERHHILHILIKFRIFLNVKQNANQIKKTVHLNINLNKYKNQKIYMYLFNETLNYDMLLRLF